MIPSCSERLAWGVYDNVFGLGDAPDLTGFKTYSQVLKMPGQKDIQGTSHALSSAYIHLIQYRQEGGGKFGGDGARKVRKICMILHDERCT